MADYIKREDALKWLEDSEIGFCDDEPIQTRNSALKIIQKIPAADVRPVVRGRWIGIDDEPHETWECDHCGKIVEHEQCSLPNFCDECGAVMDEEAQDG